MNFDLMTFSEQTGVPHELAAPLLELAVPKEMLGYYRAESELTLLELPGVRQFVCFGLLGYSDRVGLDPHTGEVVALLDMRGDGSKWADCPINSSLEQFITSVRAVLNRYPFDSPQANEESDDSYLDRTRAELDRAVDDLKRALNAIDPAAMENLDGFWMTFLDDVRMGDFSA
jgi:SUKH-4 immunity protein